MKRKVFFTLLAALLMAVFAVTVYANNPVRVQLDDEFLEVDAVIVDGRTLAPARAIVEALGGSVGWDGDLRQVTINHGNTHIILSIDSPTAYVNGAAVALDVPPQIVNSLTKVPVRFVGENLGVDVSFHYDGFVVLASMPTVAMPPIAVAEVTPAPLPAPAPAPAPLPAPAPAPAPAVSFASYQQILDYFTIRLREATPSLLDEFRTAAAGITDIAVLAEISIQKTAELAEISVAGMAEMANLWIVRGIGNESIYMDYAARLTAVYMEEAAHISALYMELARGD